MLDFWEGAYDVLVATTIIESGLDLPQVNTLIVERRSAWHGPALSTAGSGSDRVKRAYAYLFHPEEQRLTEEAYRRLEAIGEFAELRFGVSPGDARRPEIRSAGSVLGKVQSGHISAVGFDLYIELVAEAVGELETGVKPEPPAPEFGSNFRWRRTSPPTMSPTRMPGWRHTADWPPPPPMPG